MIMEDVFKTIEKPVEGLYKDKAITDVIEEVADVTIMIKQIMMLLDISESEVNNVEISKLKRLEKRMNNEV